jgi:hypothetical protein
MPLSSDLSHFGNSAPKTKFSPLADLGRKITIFTPTLIFNPSTACLHFTAMIID